MAQARGLREGGIGEVIDVRDARLALLGGDLCLQVVGHPLELGNHHLDLVELTPLLADLEPLQPDEILA